MPPVAMHDADAPRIAIYSSWIGTQEIGWVRFTFDKFGIPYDLIYKERVSKGNLRADYDVIVMPTQTAGRQAVFQPPAARPVPYMKSDKYKFLGDVRRVARHHRRHGRRRRRRVREVPRRRRHAHRDGRRRAVPDRARAGAHGRRVRRRRRATSTRRARSSTPRSCASSIRCSTATRRRSCRSSTSAARC